MSELTVEEAAYLDVTKKVNMYRIQLEEAEKEKKELGHKLTEKQKEIDTLLEKLEDAVEAVILVSKKIQ